MNKILTILFIMFVSCSPEGQSPQLKVAENIEAEYFTDNSPFWYQVWTSTGEPIRVKTNDPTRVYVISLNEDGTALLQRWEFNWWNWIILGTKNAQWDYTSIDGLDDVFRIKVDGEWKIFFVPDYDDQPEDTDLQLFMWNYQFNVELNNNI